MAELKRIRELVDRLSADQRSDAIFELIDLYLDAGLVDAALDAARQWSANNPESEKGQVVLARVSLENQLYDETRSILQRLDPASSVWRSGLEIEIDLELRLGNFHLAEHKIADYRRLYGSSEDVERLAGLLRHKVQQKGDVAPDEPVVVTPTMADLYFRQGLVEKALVLYQKLLEVDPDNVLYQNRISQIYGERHCSEPGANGQSPGEHHQKLTRWLSRIQRRRTHV